MNTALRPVESPDLPKTVGAYSPAVRYKDLITVSGQIAIDHEGNNLCNADIKEQVRCIFDNLRRILKAAGSSLDNVLDVTVFMTNIGEFGEFDEEYGRQFGAHRPTRAAVGVPALPKGAGVELKVLAVVDESKD